MVDGNTFVNLQILQKKKKIERFREYGLNEWEGGVHCQVVFLHDVDFKLRTGL